MLTHATANLPMHPTLSCLLRALDDAGIGWCLLRGMDDLVRPSGDVDLLVEAEGRSRVAAVARAVGFSVLPAFGHSSHRFFITYHAESCLWIKVDVVSQLAFGRLQELPIPVAPQVLARRVREGPLWVPHPDDAYWHLLLHCLLDKGAIRPRRRDELAQRAAMAGVDGPLAHAVTDCGVNATALLTMTRAGEWGRLITAAPLLRAAFTAVDPIRSRRVTVVNRILQAVSSRFPRPLTGMTVELTGPSSELCYIADDLAATWPTPARVIRTTGRKGSVLARSAMGLLRGELVIFVSPATDSAPILRSTAWRKPELVLTLSSAEPAGRNDGPPSTTAALPRTNSNAASTASRTTLSAARSLEEINHSVTAAVWRQWRVKAQLP
jgi:hypothetical protein